MVPRNSCETDKQPSRVNKMPTHRVQEHRENYGRQINNLAANRTKTSKQNDRRTECESTAKTEPYHGIQELTSCMSHRRFFPPGVYFVHRSQQL